MAKTKTESSGADEAPSTDKASTTPSSLVKVRKNNTVPRKITKAQFQAVGVADQEVVEFNHENNFTAEVSETAAKHLTEKDDFKVAD